VQVVTHSEDRDVHPATGNIPLSPKPVTTSKFWKVPLQSFQMPGIHSMSILLCDLAVTAVICGTSAGTMSVEMLETERAKSLLAADLAHISLT
jgi:hypothetical protein